MTKHIDILIIGGGLTGASLMLALEGLGLNCILVEAKPFADKLQPDFDARSLALSPASKRILSMLSIWDLLQPYATEIDSIHVSDQNNFGVSRLQRESDHCLGYVVEMQYINHALQQLLNTKNLLAPATLKHLDLDNRRALISTESEQINFEFKLIVAADGAESSVRKLCNMPAQTKNYQQDAIVANIGLRQAHANQAFERFTKQGPLALLPMSDDRMAMVWAMSPKNAEACMHLSDQDFLKHVQQAFGYRLGRLCHIGKRSRFPLKQVIMPQQISWPLVFVGNAAHTLHPVAGQGFNLGLRDVATLAQCIAQYGLKERMLQEYVLLRKHDQQVITRCTDGLVQVFTSRLPGMAIARSLGLLAVDTIPALRNLLAHYARGFGGVIPDLVCEIALNREDV